MRFMVAALIALIASSEANAPPRAVDFLADPSQTIPLPTGHVGAIHRIQPQSIVFSVTTATTARGSKESPPKKAMSDKPGWRPW
jgi:hypothetical protein